MDANLTILSINGLSINKSFISNTTVGYIMPEQFSIDIDTQLDWDFAEYLMKKSL